MPRVVPQYKLEAKGRILDSAAQVFAEKGYSRATMDDVAKKIGVSKGALYLYFKSKEKLFEESCRTAVRDLEENLNSAFSGPDLEKGASAYFDKEIRLSAAGVTMWLQTLAEARSNKVVRKMQQQSDEKVLDSLTKFVDVLKKRGLVRQELDSLSIARVFSAFHDGIIVSLLQETNEPTARETWKAGLHLIINGTKTSLRSESLGASKP